MIVYLLFHSEWRRLKRQPIVPRWFEAQSSTWPQQQPSQPWRRRSTAGQSICDSPNTTLAVRNNTFSSACGRSVSGDTPLHAQDSARHPHTRGHRPLSTDHSTPYPPQSPGSLTPELRQPCEFLAILQSTDAISSLKPLQSCLRFFCIGTYRNTGSSSSAEFSRRAGISAQSTTETSADRCG